MSKQIIRLHSDTIIKLIAPVDHADPSAPVVIDSADTAEVRLYDMTKYPDVKTAAAAAAGPTVELDTIEPWPDTPGRILNFHLDDNSVHSSAVTSLVGTTLTLTTAIPGGRTVRKDIRVYRKLGATLTAAGYNLGSAAVTTTNWGWAALIPDTHSDLYHKQLVLAEFLLDAGAGKMKFAHKHCKVISSH